MAHRVTARRGVLSLATLGLRVLPRLRTETEEARSGPMGASYHVGDGGERAIALVLVKETVVQHEDAVCLATPLAHEPSPGLLRGSNLESDLTVPRHGPRKRAEPPPRRLAQTAIGLLLDLIS